MKLRSRNLDTLELSLQYGLKCDPADDRTRQDQKQGTDPAFIVSRVGLGVPVQFESGYRDYTMDLTLAHAVHREAQDAWASMRESERKGAGSYAEYFYRQLREQLKLRAGEPSPSRSEGEGEPDQMSQEAPGGAGSAQSGT